MSVLVFDIETVPDLDNARHLLDLDHLREADFDLFQDHRALYPCLWNGGGFDLPVLH